MNNTNKILYIGGVGTGSIYFRSPDFKGIISVLRVNGAKLDLFADSLLRKNIETYNTCEGIECKNDGVCISTQNNFGYKCHCSDLYYGSFCEKRKDCIGNG